MSSQTIDEIIVLIEKKLGLKLGFFEALDDENENDWSFVIKLHALAEAAISYLLTENLGRPELADIFARLDMSNKATGKAAFVKALGLLDEPERRFVSALSELRNKLVHGVQNVDFDLAQHVEQMKPRDRDGFLNNFNLVSTEVTDDVRDLFRHDPRQALWYSSMAFLAAVYLGLNTGEPR